MKLLLIGIIAVLGATGAIAQRISVNGAEFKVGGNRIWISGANTPWENWNDFGGKFEPAWWRSQLQALHRNHVNATRVWLSCSGENASPGIKSDGTVIAPTSKFWSDADQLFAIAKSEHVYLMVALISFDHTKAGNHNFQAWQNMQRTQNGRASFVSQYAVPLVKRYGSNPYFFAIDVGNELDWHWDNQGMRQADTVDLIARVANAAHRYSHVLVCQGMGTAAKYLSAKYKGNCLSDTSLNSKQPGAYVDFYNIHYYDWVRQWFSSPFESTPADMGLTGKPCIVGEMPAKGSAGQTIEANYRSAFALGWQGVMPWTSNGVDTNGKLSDMAPGARWFFGAHPQLLGR